jgi:hypothetical protein
LIIILIEHTAAAYPPVKDQAAMMIKMLNAKKGANFAPFFNRIWI